MVGVVGCADLMEQDCMRHNAWVKDWSGDPEGHIRWHLLLLASLCFLLAVVRVWPAAPYSFLGQLQGSGVDMANL